MADSSSSSISYLAHVGKLGCVGLGVGVVCLGGLCIAGVRYARRVFVARRRLHELLVAAVGAEGRVVITGATSGIGQELAWQLAKHPSVSVLIGCRDVKRAERIYGRFQAKCKIVRLELLDSDSVQSFTDEAFAFLAEGEDGLRMLINNAGVMKPPQARAGVDPTWQTNFFGPFLITELLARHRNKHASRTKPCRVVQVSSRMERRSSLDSARLDAVGEGKGGDTAYPDSKRAMMLWTSVRAQNLAFKSGLFVQCATPGFVDTQLGRNSISPYLWPLTKPIRMLLLRSAAEGALGIAAAGLHKKATDTYGRFMDGETDLEDLVMERMGEKAFALQVVKWATGQTALEQRAEGYDK